MPEQPATTTLDHDNAVPMICGEVGTGWPGGEPMDTPPCALAADHEEEHDWAQREAAAGHDLNWADILNQLSQTLTRDAAYASVHAAYIHGVRHGAQRSDPALHRALADVDELHRTLTVAKAHRDTAQAQAAAAEAARVELVNELASANQQQRRAEAALRHTQAAVNTAITGRQTDAAELEQLTRTIARQVNQIDDLRQELVTMRQVDPDLIAQAIGNPGSIVGPRLGPSWGEEHPGYRPEQEYVVRWSTRAVLAVLEQAGQPSATVPGGPSRDRYAEGYAAAVAVLRDDDRYEHWWTASIPSWGKQPGPAYWGRESRGHLADYLATVGPDGPDVEAFRSRDERYAAIVAQALAPYTVGNCDVALSADRAAEVAVQALADRWAFGPGGRCGSCGDPLPRATGGTEPVQCQDCWLDNPNAEPAALEESTIPDPWRPVIEAAVAWRALVPAARSDQSGVRNLAQAVDELLRAWPGVDLSMPAVSIAEVYAEQQEPARGIAHVDPLGLRQRLELAAEQPPAADGDVIAFRVACATKPSLCTIAWHNHPAAGQ